MADGFTQICRTAQELTPVQISSNGAAAVSSFNSCSLHADLNYPNPLTAQAGEELDGPHELTGPFPASLWPENLLELCAHQATD